MEPTPTDQSSPPIATMPEIPTTNVMEPVHSNASLYILAFALIAVIGLAGFVFYFTQMPTKTVDTLGNAPVYSTKAPTTTVTTTTTTTPTPTKISSSQSAQTQLNINATAIDNAAQQDSTDTSSINSDFANTNQGSSEQTSSQQL